MKFYLVILFLFCSALLRAADPDSVAPIYSKISWPFIRSGFTDARDLAVSPLHWKGKQWVTFAAVAGTGVLVYSQDTRIRNFVQSHRSGFSNQLSRNIFEPWGSGMYSIPFVGGIYVLGRLTQNDRISGTALTSVKAAVISSVLVETVKQAAHRHRPYQDIPANPANWNGPLSSLHFTSFPSGHSALAFSIATVFASEYQETIWVPVLAYTIATGSALSRVHDDKHWASDVVVGAAAGYFTGKFIWKLNRRLSVIPVITGNSTSLAVILPIRIKNP